MERICANCALKTLKDGLCPVFNADMSEEYGCPYFATELQNCNICGNLILQGGVVDINPQTGNYVLMCDQCGKGPLCATCRYHNGCRFDHDTSCKEPQYIMVQQRQGNAIIQSQQLNPKRVQATCAQGCPCFYEEGLDDGNFCMNKMGFGCRSYNMNVRN